MATSCIDYDFSQIEPHWQSFWEEKQSFHAEDFAEKPHYYILSMFPYPSGNGLHLGHTENYTAPDILARYLKARGHNVLQPMGWDAFGLPTEQTAVQTGIHPRVVTQNNVELFRNQLKRHGFGIDWDREVNTTDPHYFRWTQWIFLQLFKHGLAYVDEKPVWWCPALGTVLANEEIIDGLSERGKHPVERRKLRQWVLRITAYADKLLAGLEDLDWPSSTKKQQTEWIGRSEGAEVVFGIENHPQENITVFTTRPDTLFGATYMVLAPEHPLVSQLTTSDHEEEVAAYIQQAASKSDLDRTDLAKDKSGVFTGSFAVNPVNGNRIPIWIADYVLMSYGTGAIMAVPAHDERDYEFAQQYDLPIVTVIEKKHDESNGKEARLPYTGEGVMVHSDDYTGMDSREGIKAITAALEKKGKGRATVNYKLRDWLFSRQRYWGEPFPIIWVEEDSYRQAASHKDWKVNEFVPEEPVTYTKDGKDFYALPLPDSQLPLTLPETDSYQPSGTGESPLATITDWIKVWVNLETGETVSASEDKPEGDNWVNGHRENNTMPQWAGSCWYHLRYCDPRNADAVIGRETEKYWGYPDLYIGGAEHAVLHLLYARFWHMFLCDLGILSGPEPYKRLYHQGLILGEDGEKMSKSRGNVVNPDEVIKDYGADSLRMFIMFMGPFKDSKPWSSTGIEGIHRFLRRAWRLFIDREGNIADRIMDSKDETEDTVRLLHESIKKVSEDIEELRFNTAISQLMILSNQLQKADTFTTATAKAFLQLLAPFAPHMAEELWERMGEKSSIMDHGWPEHDESQLVTDEVKIIFQVNGKYRGDAMLPASAGEEDALKAAHEHPRVSPHLDGKTIRKVIFVPGKILNVVAN